MSASAMNRTLASCATSAETGQPPALSGHPRLQLMIAQTELVTAALATACRLCDKQQALVAKLARQGPPPPSAIQLLDTLQASLDLLERRRTAMLGIIDCIASGHLSVLQSRELLDSRIATMANCLADCKSYSVDSSSLLFRRQQDGSTAAARSGREYPIPLQVRSGLARSSPAKDGRIMKLVPLVPHSS